MLGDLDTSGHTTVLFQLYICYFIETLSGRPGGYPDDDLIIKKNTKKTHTSIMNMNRNM